MVNQKLLKYVGIGISAVLVFTGAFIGYKKLSKPKVAIYTSENGLTVSEIGKDLAKLKESDIQDEVDLVRIAIKEGYITEDSLRDEVTNKDLAKILCLYLKLDRPEGIAPFLDIAKLPRNMKENITAVYNARIMFGDTVNNRLVYTFRPNDLTTKEEWGLIYNRVSRYLANPDLLKSEIEKEYVGFNVKSEDEAKKSAELAEQEKEATEKATQLAEKPTSNAKDYAKPGEKVENGQIVTSKDYWDKKEDVKTIPEGQLGTPTPDPNQEVEKKVEDTINDFWSNVSNSGGPTSDITQAQAAQILQVTEKQLTDLLSMQNNLVGLLGSSKKSNLIFNKVQDKVSLITPLKVNEVTYNEETGVYCLCVTPVLTEDLSKDKKLFEAGKLETYIVGKQFGLTEQQCHEIYALGVKAYYEGSDITKDYVVNGKTYKLTSSPFGVYLSIEK